MQYLFLIILIGFTVFSYKSDKKDIGSPFFISCVAFLACLFFGLFFYSKWNVEIEAITIFMVVSALVAFGLGHFFSKQVLQNKKKSFYAHNVITVGRCTTIIFFFFGIVIVLFNVIQKVQIAKLLGYSGAADLLKAVRMADSLNIVNETNIFLFLAGSFLNGVGYVYTFIIVNNIIIKKNVLYKNKLSKANWLPIIPFLINNILSASRYYIFIYFFMLFFYVVFIFYMQKHDGSFKLKEIRKILLLSIAGIIFFFVFMGMLRGDIQNVIDSFAIYLSSSLAAFNNVLKDGIRHSEFFGQETLFGIRYILAKLGFNVTQFGINQQFISFNASASTNIYTALKAYLADYGYGGMLVIQFVMGFLYSYFYYAIRNRGKIDCAIIVYSFLAFPLVYQIFTPEFTGSFLGIFQISTLISIILVYKIIVRRIKD
jgi:oligosaccharide repeat unit polymerase